jgi:NitT/TauT family transport system permease protein
MKNKLKEPALAVGSVLIWVFLWQIGATIANKSLTIKIPLPVEVLNAFCKNCLSSKFWEVVFRSVARIVSGFLLAVAVGTVGGMLAGHYKIFKIFTSPILHLVRTVPVAAFIILAWLWIPSKMLPTCISFLMVLPIIWGHVDGGLSTIDNDLVEMASVFGYSKTKIMVKIKLPLIAPQLRAGCISGLGIAWKSGVAAEIISSPTGSLGALLSSAKTSINYEQVFAVTLMVVILSEILENIMKLLWKEQKR